MVGLELSDPIPPQLGADRNVGTGMWKRNVCCSQVHHKGSFLRFKGHGEEEEKDDLNT